MRKGLQSALLFYHFCMSVCLSVRPAVVLHLIECIYCHFFHLLVREITLVFCRPTAVTKFQENYLNGALNTRGVGKKLRFDRNRRLSRKWYDIGPWLLWITNGKSQAADRSVSVPMTLSDLQRGHFSADLRIRKLVPFDLYITTKFGAVTRVGGACFYGWSPRPHSKGRGPSIPKFTGPTCAHAVWETATKSCMVIKPDERKVFTGSTTS